MATPMSAIFVPMKASQQDYVDCLRRLNADPEQSVHTLSAELRNAGMRGGDHELRMAIRAYQNAMTNVATMISWTTRAKAAAELDVCIQRVDQLRRAGSLAWERNPHTGEVRINTESLRRLRNQRAAR